MAADEGERALPRVGRGVRELLLLAVEEAVRRAVVRDDLVLDARGGQRGVEGSIVLGGDVPVGACLEREDRRCDPVGDVRVGEPVITGTEAAVAVSYTLDGNEQRDGITLVEIDGSWWLDTVARTS